jgi:hypothetical protein
MRFWPRTGAAALAGLAVAAAGHPARAQITLTPPQPAQTLTLLQAAELLIQNGRLAEARRVLLSLEAANPRDSEVQFLLAMISVQQKDYPGAIRRFRAILVREPAAQRVRLELARAFYLEKDYDNAERQFRFARAGEAPPEVKANIDHYLYLIRRERRFSYSVSVAAAPDTNLNAGPSINTVSIFGLPFQLSDQARRQSGVGLSLDASGEWSPAIGDLARMRVGAQFHRSDYSGGTFDDTTVSGYAGPRFLGPRWEISPLATAFQRWYGGLTYEWGAGGALQGTYYPTPKLGVTASFSGQQMSFRAPGMNGPSLSTSVGAFYTADPATVISGALSVARQEAQLSVYANTAWQLQLGFYRDLPHGFSVAVQPSYAVLNYDGDYVAFGTARRDRLWAVQTSLLNRRIDWWGFTPRVAYTYTSNASSIALFAYDKQRVEVGLTRNF